MVDWASGLLGGIMGGGNAVADIAQDKRKELAERLKMEAQAEIDAAYQGRAFKHDEAMADKKIGADKELQGENFKHESAMADKKIASDEKLASEHNQLLRDLAEQENSLKRELSKVDQDSAKAAEMRAKIAAFTEARNILASGGSTDEANAPLMSIGLPGFSERVVDEGSEGFLGIGDRPRKIERTWDGAPGAGGSPGSTLKDELDSLLNDGLGDKPKPPPAPPKSDDGGFLSSAQAAGPEGSGNEKDKAPRSIAENYSDFKVSGGYVWGKDKNGNARRLFPVEEATVKYGNREYPNPKYAEFKKKMAEMGLTEN